MKMDLSKFNDVFKEHYVKPMDEFYREHYRKLFQEDPPEDSKVMMDRIIKHGESQIVEILGGSHE
jgi:hypothetical protein